MATNPDPNGGPYQGPYTDPKLTASQAPWGPFGQLDPTPAPNLGKSIPTPVPARANSKTLGEITVYDPVTPEGVDLVDHTPDNRTAVVPPHSPNSWKVEDVAINADTPIASTQTFPRDPYRNGGMIGQPYVNNAGTPNEDPGA